MKRVLVIEKDPRFFEELRQRKLTETNYTTFSASFFHAMGEMGTHRPFDIIIIGKEVEPSPESYNHYCYDRIEFALRIIKEFTPGPLIFINTQSFDFIQISLEKIKTGIQKNDLIRLIKRL
jgi:hypothetical protein